MNVDADQNLIKIKETRLNAKRYRKKEQECKEILENTFPTE